jgi:mono/diheme cytochrome c family protein
MWQRLPRRFGLAVGAALIACVWLGGPPEARAGQEERTTVWHGVYTAEQARRGAEAYARACAECHGADLGGGDMAPGLAGVQFAYNWHGFSARDLFERLRVSMPPDQPNRVSRQDKADILAFMLEANGMPAGDAELASRAGPLGAIQFLAEP